MNQGVYLKHNRGICESATQRVIEFLKKLIALNVIIVFLELKS